MQDFMQNEIEEKQEQQLEEDDCGIELIDISQVGDKPCKKLPEQPEKEAEPFNPLKEFVSLLATMAVAAVAVLLLKQFVIINAYIPSGSMENTIFPGDRLIGNRLAYAFDEPERGDIVIFKYPDDEEQLFVKRIIGLPGETVTIEDGLIYIGDDEILLKEGYLKEEWVVDNGPYVFVVPEDCYLVLGDNRNNSKDARYWENTYVEEDKILGKAVFTYWPFENLGKLD